MSYLNDLNSHNMSCTMTPNQYIVSESAQYPQVYNVHDVEVKDECFPQQIFESEQPIRVVVRVRPMNDGELSRREKKGIQCFPDKDSLQLNTGDGIKRPLSFNKVFNECSMQEDIFNQCGVKELITQALHGYSVTIFAFGQTGSGKTFTITGPDNDAANLTDYSSFIQTCPVEAGIIPRALRFLFDQVEKRRNEKYSIKAAYLEIYNENVQDLLNPSNKSLAVRWTAAKGFFVENSFVVECEVLADCLAVLEEGLRNRKTASHKLNEHSSRSHSLMTIYIEHEILDGDIGGSSNRNVKRVGKISFVDLAGSEKVKESKATGETLLETLSINKSLLTLGNCISALSDPKKRTGHIPYRDSKLTKLLADSLGGHGLALMIACVGPSANCHHETLKTLRYALRARKIKNKPLVRMGDPKEELIAQLRRDLKEAKMEGDILRNALMKNNQFLPLIKENVPNLHQNPNQAAIQVIQQPLPAIQEQPQIKKENLAPVNLISFHPQSPEQFKINGIHQIPRQNYVEFETTSDFQYPFYSDQHFHQNDKPQYSHGLPPPTQLRSQSTPPCLVNKADDNLSIFESVKNVPRTNTVFEIRNSNGSLTNAQLNYNNNQQIHSKKTNKQKYANRVIGKHGTKSITYSNSYKLPAIESHINVVQNNQPRNLRQGKISVDMEFRNQYSPIQYNLNLTSLEDIEQVRGNVVRDVEFLDREIRLLE